MLDGLAGIGVLCIILALIYSQEARSERGKIEAGGLAFVGLVLVAARLLFG